MPIIDAMRMEFERECVGTKKLLERVPQEHWDFQPHPKSMTLGRLASHIAEIPQWTEATLLQDSLEFSTGGYQPFDAGNVEALMAKYEEASSEAIKLMQGVSDEDMMKSWTMSMDGKDVFSAPKVGVLRAFIISHIIHHRGQLGVYYRLKDVPLPSIYGPSADEQM